MSAPRACRAFALGIAMASAILLVAPAVAGVYGSGLFQLGDGQDPAGFAGAARIDSAGQGGVPDWADLFDADGRAVGGFGKWAVFIADDVSLGTGFESTALAGSQWRVRNGVARAADDLGNIYAYAAGDALFFGVERLSGDASSLEIEINQTIARLGHGGFGKGVPWEVIGVRSEGDLLLRLEFSGGTLTSVEVLAWSADAWRPLSATAGEGCDEAQDLCAVTNASAVGGGPWRNFDTAGDPEQISSGRFIEVGVGVGALLGVDPAWRSLRVRTPGDIAFGYIPEGN
jgi:hypothetical protein